MRYFVVFFFIAALVFSTCAFSEDDLPPQTAVTLSLKDAVGIALKNNKDIQIQEQEVAFARANIMDAQSKFFPVLGIGYSYSYNDAALSLGSLPLPSSKKDPGIFLGYKNDNQAKLTANQIVYDGGASIANFKQARVQLKIQEETLLVRKLDIEFEAKRLYYGLLLAYETLRITKDLVDQAQAHYENVREKFQQGTSSRFDALQSKVEVSKLIPSLVQAKNSIEIIANDLKKLLYLNMNSVIRAGEKLSYSPVEIKLEEFLNEAYGNSPQMKLKLLGIDLNKWSIEYAKSGYYPDINASAGYSYRSDDLGDMFNSRHSNWNIGVSGSVSIFDGFSTKAKVDEAKARYAQAILGKENIVEQIAVDIRRGCLDMQEAHAVILSQKDNIAEARDALNISYIRYDNGVGINLDVIDSQVSLSQVEKNLASGVYDYIMAKAFLDKVMGREYLSFKEEEDDQKR